MPMMAAPVLVRVTSKWAGPWGLKTSLPTSNVSSTRSSLTQMLSASTSRIDWMSTR